MDYRFDNEQILLKESLEGWLSRNYGFEQWRGLAASDRGFAETNWHAFAEMGWLGIGIPEEFGGLGFGAVERMLIGEAFGRHLVNEPYLGSTVLAGSLMLRAGTEAQKAEWLPRMAAGEARLAFAFAETTSRFHPDHVATSARRQASRWVLSGEKILVLDARAADRILILARTSGETGDRHGLGLFLVDPAADGLSLRTYTTVDDRRASDIVLDGAVAEALIGDDGGAFQPLERCVDDAILYLCAEALGAMEVLFDMTRHYAKARRQFGQAIGDFQVIQHRIVDMRVQIECARALLLHAVAGVAGDDPVARARAASAAKVQMGKSARIVGRSAIQIHGGMGMTDELPVGHYFKRLVMAETFLGDIAFHQKRFSSLPSELA